jgi:hypothetical protein
MLRFLDQGRYSPVRGEPPHKSRRRRFRAAETVASRTSSLRQAGRIAPDAASLQEIRMLVAVGKGVCPVPPSVAHRYARTDVVYVEVSDAEPAVVSLARPRGGLRQIVGAFIEITRQPAPASAKTIVATSANRARSEGSSVRAAASWSPFGAMRCARE